MNTQLHNKSGTLTRYGFACGYLERKEKNDNRITLGLDCIYHVKGFINGSRVWECFDKLTDARKFYNSVKI